MSVQIITANRGMRKAVKEIFQLMFMPDDRLAFSRERCVWSANGGTCLRDYIRKRSVSRPFSEYLISRGARESRRSRSGPDGDVYRAGAKKFTKLSTQAIDERPQIL